SQQRKKKLNSREVRKFYEEQNAQIAAYLKPTERHADDADGDAEKAKFRVKVAVYASLIANLCLAGLQLYAATSSLSLSFFATAADSVFDPFASFMLAYVHRKSQKLDPAKWPVGGARLQSIANICYSFLMITVNVILIVESIRSLVEGNPNETNDLHVPSLVAVAVALATKFSLFLFCWTIKSSSSQVQILWEDHRNDLPVNSFGILTNAGGAKLRWWIDPMGAMIIAVGVITSWTITGWQEFSTLIGKNASLDFQRFIVYKAMTFSEEFIAIDNIKAYTMGPELYVEVDVVMKPDTPLWQSHDLSQKFQDDLETLPGVGRAFVHVDHEVEHSAEHNKRK
ncbi:CDF-like metal transporter, partial [Cystobasidium minutum MCA 4210]|uniref:CDF-like metal transporter n=1 Tax=Cystobasidium minutum MCA 4210 TaxID=1397322 RepID=UPI0034CE0077